MGTAIEAFQSYMGTGLVTVLFLLALIYLFICEKRKPRRILFVYTPIILLLFIFNPLFTLLFERLVGPETYFRLFWLLPYLLVLPYTTVLLTERLKGKRAVLVGLTAAGLIMASGKLVYTNPLYSRAENSYHVPDSVIYICDAIKVPGREVMAVFPRELLLYVRQYSPVVCMPYGREVFMGVYSPMYEIMESEQLDLEQLLPLARERGCHYIVLRRDKEIVGDTAECGLELFFETEEYFVYRDTDVELEIPQEIEGE